MSAISFYEEGGLMEALQHVEKKRVRSFNRSDKRRLQSRKYLSKLRNKKRSGVELELLRNVRRETRRRVQAAKRKNRKKV